jgi:hypothetical protein
MILEAATTSAPQVDPQATPQVSELLAVIQGEMTIPDKPNSRLQRYRLTDKGRLHVAHIRSPHHTDNNLNIQE